MSDSHLYLVTVGLCLGGAVGVIVGSFFDVFDRIWMRFIEPLLEKMFPLPK